MGFSMENVGFTGQKGLLSATRKHLLRPRALVEAHAARHGSQPARSRLRAHSRYCFEASAHPTPS